MDTDAEAVTDGVLDTGVGGGGGGIPAVDIGDSDLTSCTRYACTCTTPCAGAAAVHSTSDRGTSNDSVGLARRRTAADDDGAVAEDDGCSEHNLGTIVHVVVDVDDDVDIDVVAAAAAVALKGIVQSM